MNTRSSYIYSDQDKDGGEKKCRACLVQHSNHQVYSLDSENLTVMNDGSEQTIAEIYHQCTQLAYKPSDDYPKWICQHCMEKLIDFFQFRKMCIDSYNTLKISGMLNSDNSHIKVEIVSGDAHNDCTVLADSSVIKKENDFDPVNELIDCHQIVVEAECIPENPKPNSKRNDNEINMTSGESIAGEFSSIEADTEKNEDDQCANDDNDSNFNDFSDLDDDDDDDSSDDSSEPSPKPSTRKKKTIASTTAKTSKSAAEKPKSSTKYFACDKCPRKFIKDYRYNAHMRRHNGLKAYKCEHCDKEFQKYYTLKEHTAISHFDETNGNRVAYICDVNGCGKEYTRKQTLRVHIQVVHEGKKLPKIKKMCELCGKVFKDNESLARHSYTHTKQTPYKCELCPKMFTSAKGRKEHMLRHTGVKNFVCPTCGLRKTTKNELRMHMVYHSDVKFPCELCSSVFTNKENMKRHVRVVHHGERAFKCTHCDQSFGKAETLKHHVMTHTGERPHACTLCDRRFIQSVALRTHMKTHRKSK